MRILITAGPTHEPIDAVRYIANRSTGKMGVALVQAALAAGHAVTLVAGPIAVAIAACARRIDVQTAAQMHQAVQTEFPGHDLLIMAAAVADFRPRTASSEKLSRRDALTLELEPTEDILAAAGRAKRPDQRTVGFSLEVAPDLERSRRKLVEKRLDLIVYNPAATIAADRIDATLLYPDGRTEKLPSISKQAMADILIQRSVGLFSDPAGKTSLE